MKKVTFFMLCLLIIPQVIFADSLMRDQRDQFDLKLMVDDNNFYQATIEKSPYVLKDNIVQLYPGETLLLEAEVIEDKITKLTAVKNNISPDKTIEISFKQISNGKKHMMMMLSVKNPFTKDLNYKAGIYLMKYNKWISTSIEPVMAEKMSFETWPDIIVSIVLNDWTLIE